MHDGSAAWARTYFTHPVCASLAWWPKGVSSKFSSKFGAFEFLDSTRMIRPHPLLGRKIAEDVALLMVLTAHIY